MLPGLAEKILAHAESNRPQTVLLTIVCIWSIAVADWRIQPNVSLGLLYILPLTYSATVLSRKEILVYAAACSLLREAFSPFHWEPGYMIRMMMVWGAFAGTSLFLSEVKRNRALALESVEALQREVVLRGQMETRLRTIIDTSPLAVLSTDERGRVEISNRSAARLFGFESPEQAQGQLISDYLPTLAEVLRPEYAGRNLHAAMECKGRRRHGETFFASVWFSTWGSENGRQLTAVVWDDSESLRSREVAGWESLLNTSRIVIGSVMHELRNLSLEAAELHRRLLRETVPGEENLRALGELVRGIEKIASAQLQTAVEQVHATASLTSVLEELRILMAPALWESGITMETSVADRLPPVQADHHGLLQVFLNLARNSHRVLEKKGRGDLRIFVEAQTEDGMVRVRFSDTGGGVADPRNLFRPFRSAEGSAGLGLYVSQALVRSFGGELRYEEAGAGCFLIELCPARG